MTDRERPPTARERALFEAASQPVPKEFVRMCRVIGRDPQRVLDGFDAAPYRWVIGRDPQRVLDGFDAAPYRWLIVSFNTSGFVTDEARKLPFAADVQARLDVTRVYVETPWWRRLGGRR